jgi:uncharacterized protein (DUF952 family)
MREDLLFHITTQDDWKQFKKHGNYEPESLETKGFIKCSTGSQLEDSANRLYPDSDEILLLVIDVSLIREEIKYEKDEETGKKFPHIYGPLSTNAVIDKIEIRAEENGTFNIAFTSDS